MQDDKKNIIRRMIYSIKHAKFRIKKEKPLIVSIDENLDN
jgi:hypothetical protein